VWLFIFKQNKFGYPDAVIGVRVDTCVFVVNKWIFCRDAGIGIKTETCSYCKQKNFFNPDDGVGIKDEICRYLL
jgi:hypothetical protein